MKSEVEPSNSSKRVIPHFHRYPLRSGKRNDFELFASVCGAMARGRHLESEGLSEIVRWAGAMNPSGKRTYEPERILRSLLR